MFTYMYEYCSLWALLQQNTWQRNYKGREIYLGSQLKRYNPSWTGRHGGYSGSICGKRSLQDDMLTP